MGGAESEIEHGPVHRRTACIYPGICDLKRHLVVQVGPAMCPGFGETSPHQTLAFLGRYPRLRRNSESHSLLIHTVFLHRMSACHFTLVYLGITTFLGFVQLARKFQGLIV